MRNVLVFSDDAYSGFSDDEAGDWGNRAGNCAIEDNRSTMSDFPNRSRHRV